VKNNCCTH